ncbi:MAG: D-aminoacyl-tRNA deacylase [Nitrospinota bacterium]
MRAVIQRVARAEVRVEGQVRGRIESGLLTLLGVAEGDTSDDARYLANKVAGLRIFEDEEGKLNRSLLEVGGSMLIISQFTLYGDCRKGRRPSFTRAARPEGAKELYEVFCREVEALGVTVARGEFGAMMEVELVNWGPVTLMLDSRGEF